MHYAAQSPVFNAFELTIRELSEGLIGADGELPNFCSRCHSPPADRAGELPADLVTPARASMSPVAGEGLSCDFCHTVEGPDLEGSLLGDGIANLSLLFGPSLVKKGPIGDAQAGMAHKTKESSYLSSSEFCGACHDVRLPKPDLRTGEPFQRFENLFTEWAGSAYAFNVNKYGRVVSCQDCHMSLYPMTEPGIYPQTQIAIGSNLQERKHSLHAFTAVSTPLIDDAQFPRVDTDEIDTWGFPMGQAQRRAQMLRAACELRLAVPSTVDRDAEAFTVEVGVTNVGAGHRVPSGFSQERQVWLHIDVRDDLGLIYESGYLTDSIHPETGEQTPDGILDDEDLLKVHRIIDPVTFEDHAEPGPDADLVSFTNAFMKLEADGSWRDVINPLAADTIDNQRSLAPGIEKVARYQIVPMRGLVGQLRVAVRLRYRALPPELLRALAQRYPDLVNEEIVDRNLIVDMAEIEGTVVVGP